MTRTHLTKAGTWSSCRRPRLCRLPIHVDLTVEEAALMPASFIEQLAETFQPPNEITKAGDKRWHVGRRHDLHRDYDLPALIKADGSRHWYRWAVGHRVGGPAVILADGTREWHRHGKLHRTDGPARILPDGRQEWWVNGRFTRTLNP